MHTVADYEKLAAEWSQVSQQCIQYLRSVASIAGRLTPTRLPGHEKELALLQLQHLRTLEVLMAALWRNQTRLERVGQRLASNPSAPHNTQQQFELIAVRLKAILLALRYEDIPALEAHAELWAQLARTAPLSRG